MDFWKCLVYLGVIDFAAFLLGRCIPASWIKEDRFPYKAWAWEREGKIYHVLKIRVWHNRLPDMSRIFPGLMQPKKLRKEYRQDLPEMIRETCIAEFIHVLLCVAGLGCLLLWAGAGGMIMALINALANFPFILIQRYNRPRLQHLRERAVSHC